MWLLAARSKCGPGYLAVVAARSKIRGHELRATIARSRPGQFSNAGDRHRQTPDVVRGSHACTRSAHRRRFRPGRAGWGRILATPPAVTPPGTVQRSRTPYSPTCRPACCRGRLAWPAPQINPMCTRQRALAIPIAPSAGTAERAPAVPAVGAMALAAAGEDVLNGARILIVDDGRFCQRLPELVPPTAPVLLHGDLWRDNVLAGPARRPTLIDPAVCMAGQRSISARCGCCRGQLPRPLLLNVGGDRPSRTWVD